MDKNSVIARALSKWLVILTCFLSGCAHVIQSPPIHVNTHQRLAIADFDNHTTTPLAGHKVSATARAILLTKGLTVVDLNRTPQSVLKQSTTSIEQKLHKAKSRNMAYLLTGNVTEWRYKVGLDGEPAVGLTLELWDVQKRKILFSHASSMTGHYNQSLTTVGQKLIEHALASITHT